MPRLQTSARDIVLAAASIAPDNLQMELAKFARSELNATIQTGEGSDRYNRYVNGRYGESEFNVVPPGPIVYDFIWWQDILELAIQYLIDRSPSSSGLFKRSWFAMVDGQPVNASTDIDLASEVVITNDQPYARKIEVGHMRMTVPHLIVEDARNQVRRIWGNLIDVRKKMIYLPNGYILKGRFRRGFRPRARTKLHKDTQAGQPVTYPALILSMKQ